MTPEQQAAYIMAQVAILNAMVAGMVAENMQREVLGQSMAYVENDFVAAVNGSPCHHNAVLSLFQS